MLHDAIRIDGDIEATLQRAAVGAGAKVVATIIYVAPDTAEKLADLRDGARVGSPLAPATEAAATVRNGMLIARVLGPNSASVRRTVIAALTVLREDRPMPRVWLC